jgi:hypothetical protein
MEPGTQGPIVCDLTQIPAEHRDHLFQELRRTFGRAHAAFAITDGFALEFPSEHGIIASLGEIIEYDRRCCPFIRHVLIDAAWGSGIRLELTGPPEVGKFLADELGRVLPPGLTLVGSE